MPETIQRQLFMLRAVPREPSMITVQNLAGRMNDEGFETTVRTVQRDLNQLSGLVGLACFTEGRTQYWYYPKGVKPLDVPGMAPGEALVFRMAELYLTSILPASQLNTLKPYFDRAQAVIEEGAMPIAKWQRRVSIIHRSPRLRIPTITEGVVDAVHQAILSDRQLRLTYHRRGSEIPVEYVADTQGLVLRDGLLYVVALLDGSADLRHLALHRVSQVVVLDAPSKIIQDFDLNSYLHRDLAFALPNKVERQVKLILRVNQHVYLHLSERSLSEDQTIKPLPDNAWEVRATVTNTEELLWWILGFGDQMEVMRPKSLRERIRINLVKLYHRYDRPITTRDLI